MYIVYIMQNIIYSFILCYKSNNNLILARKPNVNHDHSYIPIYLYTHTLYNFTLMASKKKR